MDNFDEEDETFEVPPHWEKRRWYKRFPLSNNEEENLVMDEMEREGYKE